MTDSTCLTGNAAAVYTANDVELLGCACKLERLTNDKLECLKSEIIINISVVDGYLARTCINTNTSD